MSRCPEDKTGTEEEEHSNIEEVLDFLETSKKLVLM